LRKSEKNREKRSFEKYQKTLQALILLDFVFFRKNSRYAILPKIGFEKKHEH